MISSGDWSIVNQLPAKNVINVSDILESRIYRVKPIMIISNMILILDDLIEYLKFR